MASESYGLPPLSDEGFIILTQIFAAFAHGAGGLLINGDAILAARADYSGNVEARKEQWPTEAPVVLGLAYRMGRMAAHIALGRGSTVIDKTDYVESRQKTRSSDHHFCPFPHSPHHI
jgi:hypothetical protein